MRRHFRPLPARCAGAARFAAQQIILKLVAAAVGINDFPHHFHDAGAAFLIQRPVEQAGEVIKVDGFVLGLGCLVDQLVGQGVIEAEAPLDDGMKLVAFARRHVAVDGRGVHEQRHRCEAVIVVGELAWMFLAVDEFGDEVPQRFEHQPFPL
jgi:hypothetical protein